EIALSPLRSNGANMSFRPLHDRVVVRRVDSEEKTAGGIIIPDTAKEKPSEGVIVSVGPGARDDSGKVAPLDVKAGDRVLFGKWSDTEVKINGEDLLIMKETDIMDVIEAYVCWSRFRTGRPVSTFPENAPLRFSRLFLIQPEQIYMSAK